MKLKYKRALSILLVIIFMLTIVSPIMQTPAEAANPAIAIEAVELVIWALGLLGITFSTVESQNQAAEQAYLSIPELKAWADSFKGSVGIHSGLYSIELTAIALKQLADTVIPKVKAFFGSTDLTVPVNTGENTYYGKCVYTEATSFVSALDVFNHCPYRASTNAAVEIVYNGVTYKYQWQKWAGNGIDYELLLNGNNVYGTTADSKYQYNMGYNTFGPLAAYYDGVTFVKIVDAAFGFRKLGNYLVPMIAWYYQDSAGNFHYTSNITATNSAYCMPLNMSAVQPVTKDIEFKPVIDYSLEELKQAINKLTEMITGSISIPLDDPNWDATHGNSETTNPEDGVPYVPTTNWAEMWDALGIKDLIKTLTQNKTTTLEESDFKAPQLPTSIIDKFPFCVPFDLIAIVQTLNATPVAPSFTIPMRFDSINYTENFTIDLSGNDWNRVGKVIRWGNTLLFLAGLILITRKVIQA